MYRSIAIFLLSIIIKSVAGQGCSDAGACSTGSIALKDKEQSGANLVITYLKSFGLADKESIVMGTGIILRQYLFPGTLLEIRANYFTTFGNLAVTSGVGDPLVTFSQSVWKNKSSGFSIVAGGRLKANDANKKHNGMPLPMVYQSSLGTFDIIGGLAWQSAKWSISMAYQHPFGANKNEYLHPNSVDLPKRKQYFESAFLKRGDDLLLRIQRSVGLSSQSMINFGVLPIYRLQKDQIKRNGIYESLPQSDGITFNVFFNWFREFGGNKVFTLSFGAPLHAREYRADGLTRTSVVTGSLAFKFSKLKKKSGSAEKFIVPINPTNQESN